MKKTKKIVLISLAAIVSLLIALKVTDYCMFSGVDALIESEKSADSGFFSEMQHSGNWHVMRLGRMVLVSNDDYDASDYKFAAKRFKWQFDTDAFVNANGTITIDFR